jgi:hypothetical protein
VKSRISALAVICNGGAVRFVADQLQEAINARMRIEKDGFVFAAFH